MFMMYLVYDPKIVLKNMEKIMLVLRYQEVLLISFVSDVSNLFLVREFWLENMQIQIYSKILRI